MAQPTQMQPPRSPERRARVAIFLMLFAAYGYFHQGGGWNQTVRFSQARALVETGSFSVDDYLLQVVEVTDSGEVDYRRLPLSDPETRTRRLAQVNSYDLSLFDGHYFSNKPPGVTLLAALVYAPIHMAERLLGIDPDRWWPLTLNAYLTTALAIGLLSALGGACFFSLGRCLFPAAGVPRTFAASLAYGFGTPLLPYSTMMYDHAAVCAVSIGAFWLLARPRHAPEVSERFGLLVTAGLLAGFAVVINRAAILIAGTLLVYVTLTRRSPRAALGFALGGLGPALLLLGYQLLCFGDPFSLSEVHQLDLFSASNATVLGSFEPPRLHLVTELLVQPYRGLLFWSPVLSLAGVGLYWMSRERRLRAETGVVVAVVVLYLILNLSFSRWHGGAGIGPRYLTPMIPFLALGLIPAFARVPRITGSVAAVSGALMLLVTAVNPMVHGRYENPLTDYYLPLARGGELDEGFYRVRGPVSVNPSGIHATGLEIFSPDSRFARWNAFNLGEALFPGSWASLAPLFLIEGAIVFWVARAGRPGQRF